MKNRLHHSCALPFCAALMLFTTPAHADLNSTTRFVSTEGDSFGSPDVGNSQQTNTTGVFNQTVSFNDDPYSGSASQNTTLDVSGTLLSASGTGHAYASAIGYPAQAIGNSFFDFQFTAATGGAYILSDSSLSVSGSNSSATFLLEDVTTGITLITHSGNASFSGGGNLTAGDTYHFFAQALVDTGGTRGASSGQANFNINFSATGVTAATAVPEPAYAQMSVLFFLAGGGLLVRRRRARAC